MMSVYTRIVSSIIKNRIGIISYPLFCTYFVTWHCNARCIMCDVWKKNENEELNLEEIDKVFAQLKRLDIIRLSGGEPFMRDDLDKILQIVRKRARPWMVHITTNGLLEERITSFIEKGGGKYSRHIHFKISINAVGDKYDQIMGVKGAFDIVMKTLRKLSLLRAQYGFFLGVNQTIVDEDSLKQYDELKRMCQEYNVDVLPVFAYKKAALYNINGESTLPSREALIDTFTKFSKSALLDFFKKANEDVKRIHNFSEKIVKRYYIKGLYNRIILNKHLPNPQCVALRTHIRILPNGDIPVCLHCPIIVGNLMKCNFKDIWFGKSIKKFRDIVKNCPGCWAECETIPNAVYTGNIVR